MCPLFCERNGHFLKKRCKDTINIFGEKMPILVFQWPTFCAHFYSKMITLAPNWECASTEPFLCTVLTDLRWFFKVGGITWKQAREDLHFQGIIETTVGSTCICTERSFIRAFRATKRFLQKVAQWPPKIAQNVAQTPFYQILVQTFFCKIKSKRMSICVLNLKKTAQSMAKICLIWSPCLCPFVRVYFHL
jgi:hypothetical protein